MNNEVMEKLMRNGVGGVIREIYEIAMKLAKTADEICNAQHPEDCTCQSCVDGGVDTFESMVSVQISVSNIDGEFWSGYVYPSFLDIGGHQYSMRHGYNAKSLNELLEKMHEGTKEECRLVVEEQKIHKVGGCG